MFFFSREREHMRNESKNSEFVSNFISFSETKQKIAKSEILVYNVRKTQKT